MMESMFQKHDYSKPVKKQIKPLDEFDPRPTEFRGTASDRLPNLLKSLKGQQLSISLLLDPECRHWISEDSTSLSSEKSPVKHEEPHISNLRRTISAFKDSLK